MYAQCSASSGGGTVISGVACQNRPDLSTWAVGPHRSQAPVRATTGPTRKGAEAWLTRDCLHVITPLEVWNYVRYGN